MVASVISKNALTNYELSPITNGSKKDIYIAYYQPSFLYGLM